MNAKKKLRSMMQDPFKLIQVVGAHNGLGAKLIEKNGFDAVWASGFEISASYAVPDANILTMTEFLHASEQMVEATSLPVIADCDTGFGNVNNIVKMVKAYEKAGVAAICIEDKVFPKVNSFIPTRQKLASIPEFCSKIIAAKNTQQDPDFTVIARVEALIAGESMEEALERAEAYREAGADMILIHSKSKGPEEIFEFSSRWQSDTPLVIVPTTYDTVHVEELQERNIKMVIYANQALRAAVKSINQMLAALKVVGSLHPINDQLEVMDELFSLQGMDRMIREEKTYEAMALKKSTVSS